MQFLTDALSSALLAAEIASPLIPALVAGVVVVLLVIYFTLRSSARKKKMKKLYMSSEFGMEIEAEEIKKQSKSRFTYEKGYVPGKMPKMSFLDPERVGAPHEVVRVRETYAPSMQLPEELAKRKPKEVKGAKIPLALAKGANPYVGVTPNAVAPLAIPVTEKLERPVLTPVPERPNIKMPILPKEPAIVPPLPQKKPLMELKPPVKTPVKMPEPPRLGKIARIPDPLNFPRPAEMAVPQRRVDMAPLKIVDADGAVSVTPEALDKMKREIKEELSREIGAELMSAAPAAVPAQINAIAESDMQDDDALGASALLAAGALGGKNAPEAIPEQQDSKKNAQPKAAMNSPVVKLTQGAQRRKLDGNLTETHVALNKPIIVTNKKDNTQNEYQISETQSRPVELSVKRPERVTNPSAFKRTKGEALTKTLKDNSKPRFDENCMLTPEQIYIDELPLDGKPADTELVTEQPIEINSVVTSPEKTVTDTGLSTEDAFIPEAQPEQAAEALAQAAPNAIETEVTEAPTAEQTDTREASKENNEPEEQKEEKTKPSFSAPIIIPVFAAKRESKPKEENKPASGENKPASDESKPATTLIAAEVLRRAKANKAPAAPIAAETEEPEIIEAPAAEVEEAPIEEPTVTIDPIVEAAPEEGSNVIVLKVPEEFLKSSRFVFEDDEEITDDAAANEEQNEDAAPADTDFTDAEPCEAEDISTDGEIQSAELDAQIDSNTADIPEDNFEAWQNQDNGDEYSEHEEPIYSEPIEELKPAVPVAPLEENTVYSPEQVMPIDNESYTEEAEDAPIYSEPVTMASEELKKPLLVSTPVMSAPEEQEASLEGISESEIAEEPVAAAEAESTDTENDGSSYEQGVALNEEVPDASDDIPVESGTEDIPVEDDDDAVEVTEDGTLEVSDDMAEETVSAEDDVEVADEP